MNTPSNVGKKDLPKTPESIFFQGVSSTGTSGRITWKIGVSDFLKGVVSGEYVSGDSVKDIRDTIHSIRTNKKGSPEYNKQKKTLPGVCVQGKFKPDSGYPKGRRKKDFLSEFTNIVAIDIDNVKDISKIKSWVIEQLGKHSFVIAYSPGNKGLHVYLYAEIKSEKDIAQVLGNVSRVIGVKVDPMTKDCTRFLNCTWDPDAFINETPDQYEFITAPPTTLPDETPSKPGTGFFDIESLLTEKKLLGKVRYTDNVIWKTFLILAKRFPREHVEKYLSDGSRRKRLFHPQSATVNDIPKIKTNLDNAFIEAKKWQGEFKDFFQMESGIYRIIKSGLGESKIIPVRTDLFFAEHGKETIFKLPKYHDFGNIPNNYPGIKEVKFTPVPEGIYNLYCPLKNKPGPGSWDNVRCIFEHLFPDQVQYLYDYVKLLLINPSQILPILVLISTRRETGKTTFLNLMREIFNPNGTIISMLDFSSRFNSHYISKELVMIDESKLDKKELEKIKSLSTAEYVSLEHKGRDVTQIRNNMHFILASNNLDFTYLDKEENRFWTFEITEPKIKNLDLYNNACREIPAFINYLLYDHKMAVPKPRSRAWFPINIITDHFRSSLYDQVKHSGIIQLYNRCSTLFAENFDLKEIRFSAEDVHRFYNVKMSIPVFRGLIGNEDWIYQYESKTRLQYHSDFLTGLPDVNPISPKLSARNDQRRSLFYVRRSDVINPDDDDDDETTIPF